MQALTPHRQTMRLPIHRRITLHLATFLLRIFRLTYFSPYVNGKRQVTFALPPPQEIEPTSRRWPYTAYAALLFVILRSTWLGRVTERLKEVFADKFRIR